MKTLIPFDSHGYKVQKEYGVFIKGKYYEGGK